MHILPFRIIDQQTTVIMPAADIDPLLGQQFEQRLLSHASEIPGQDSIVILRLPVKIFQVCRDRPCCCRRHRTAHIEGILDSEILYPPYCNTCYSNFAAVPALIFIFDRLSRHGFPRCIHILQQKRSASRHCPRCVQRSLSTVLERISELLLRTRKVARSQAHDTVRISRRHAHAPKTQSFPAGGTRAV